MRLKNDFITNSSSTSYIVFIPEDFDAANHLWAAIEEVEIDKDEVDIAELSDLLVQAIFTLREDGVYNQADDLGPLWCTLCEVMKKSNLIIYRTEVGSGLGNICNLNTPYVQGRIKEIKEVL